MYTENLCMGCMEQKRGSVFCPHCGWEAGKLPDSPLYLTPGIVLNDQYLIGRVLGHGGFGITYLAWDFNLSVKVAIKEYLPGALASRHPGSAHVTAYSGEAKGHFDYGLEKFIEEARALARFQNHPGVVSVVNFFRANGTGYIAMTYIEGITLKDYLDQNGDRLEFDKARSILMPVMDALREIHAAGMLHRDISPDNIYLTFSNQVKLLDFGAAKYAVGEHSQSLSVILKPGFAPEEQYRSRGHQGPWTDVYALGATMYRAITGEVPPDALDRMERDEMTPPTKLGVEMPPEAEAALMKALAVRATARIQDVATFQNAISPKTAIEPGRVTTPEISNDLSKKLKKAQGSLVRWRIAGVFLLITTIASATGWIVRSGQLADELENARNELRRVENQLYSEKESRTKLVDGHPTRQLTVTNIELRNENKAGNSLDFLGAITRRFRREDIRFISFDLYIQNNWIGMKDLEGELGIKYINPDGSLRKGEKSPEGYTYTKTLNVKDSEKIQGGWGNADSSGYSTGPNRIEFWWAGKKIAQISFEVYE